MTTTPEPIVVITGAEGNLGRKLVRHLDALGGYRLRLLDRIASDDPRSVACDLTVRGAWEQQLAGADALVHLAGNPRPQSSWEEVIPANIDATFNLFRCAVEQGLRRVVFASSNFAVSGHRFERNILRSDLPGRPTNAYGATKVFGERLAKGWSDASDTSFVCLRIGFCQRLPGNQPGAHMRHGLWGQQMWLSDRDFCQAVEKAIAAKGLRFAVLNIESANPGMRWEIDTAREAIGYVPLDGAAPKASPLLLFRQSWQRGVDGAIKGLERIFGGVR